MSEEMEMHRQAFKEEAYELLAELEISLLEWEGNSEDSELVQRVFRAMHTIKGSGSMFGFDDIASFTHQIESLLDLARENKIEVTRELIDLTLEARDHIKDMVDASDGGEPVDEARTKELEARAKILAPSPTDGNGGALQAAGKSPSDAAEEMEEVTYRVRFTPNQDIFGRGTDPLLLLRELRDLGTCAVIAHIDKIPKLGKYKSEACYTYWDIIITTAKGKNAIKDVFIFVEDDCDLKIDVIDHHGRFNDETSYKKLGEILTSRGDITQEDLKDFLEKKPLLGEMLVNAGVVPPEQVQSALVEQQHVKEVKEHRKQASSALSIRVPSEKLDHLVDLVGEMVTVQARLRLTSDKKQDPELLSVSEEVERLTEELRDNTMSIRMVPIGSVFDKFRRLVRDLSHQLGKEVEMITTGSETELDKSVIERLNDPLVHLVRNSIDHGIEMPQERMKKNKPRQGLLQISAAHSGANVLIRIKDDGAGIDPEVIKAKAIEKRLIAPDAQLGEQEIYNLVFAPGFSTSKILSDVSGRGVGMDVVRRNIEALRGSVEIESTKGSGTEITLKIPLTLAIIDGLLVNIGKEYFVIPLLVIEECVELTAKDVADNRGRETITVRNELVPYIRLRERFGINGEPPEIEQVVIGSINSQRIGLVVDRVIGDHQTVIKALGRVFKEVSDISGATILGDGTVALIMDVNKLLKSAELKEASR